jgi:YfiH family protein
MTLPPVPDSFEWIDQSWGAAIRCTPLHDHAPHLFTTRQLESTSPARAAVDKAPADLLAAALGTADVVLLTQVHGNDVAVIRDESPLPAERPRADAAVSDARNTSIAVRVADCVPLLMADPKRGSVAAVHAGWRGTAARVAPAAIDAMQREFGARVEDLVVAIGPSIRRCCYEVGSDVVDAFAAAGHERYLIDRWFAAPPARPGESRQKLRLDVAGSNRDQLILAGVREQNIFDCGLCTAMHLDVLTSYRVEKEKAGRLFAAIARR